MKRFFTFVLVCLAVWSAVNAVPAKRGIRTFTQKDGSKIHLQLAGDEWHHSFLTEEGYAVSRNEAGDFCYRTTDGISSVVAHDLSGRSATEKQFVSANAEKMSLQALFSESQSARRSRALVARKSSQVPQTGSPRIPVILVNYKDKKFISTNPKTVWQEQISAANQVSVYQYFVDQSFGKYTPQFDIYGPYTLANNRSTYGGNDYSGNDKGVGKMVGEACSGMDSSIDWTKYDNDGDGVCDVVIVLYAGDGEASSYDSDAENSVWPCQWDLASSDYGKNLTLDGVTVSKFAVFNELYGQDLTKIDGIGTMCHEFSHCLDLPDFYCTNYGNYFGMGSWSLLDYGSYNNDGYTPCGYTAYERNFMGWYDYETPVEGKRYTTQPVADGGKAIKVTTPSANEYFVIENIQKTGWNAYAPAAGLQVTHVTYTATKWTNNTVNNSNPQGMTIIPADNSLKMTYYSGYYYLDTDDEVGDLFPYNGHNELTSTSTPKFAINGSGTFDKPITNITQNTDGSVSYTYIAQPVEAPVANDAADVTSSSFKASWNACEDAVSYTLKVNPKPSYTNILSETFAKFTSTYNYSIENSLDTYMDNAGWTGTYDYREVGGIRLGSSNYTGSLVSPALDLTNSGGKVTVAVTAKSYSNDTGVNLTVSIGSSSETFTLTSAGETKYIVLDCAENATQKVKFANAAKRKRAVITGIVIYSGDASALASASAPSESRTDDVITVTGITDTQYTVTGLNPETDYQYTVKAIYANDESAWSNVVNFTTLKQSTVLTGDVNNDGVVDVADINCIVGILINGVPASTYEGRADVNGDGDVDIADINSIIEILLGNN